VVWNAGLTLLNWELFEAEYVLIDINLVIYLEGVMPLSTLIFGAIGTLAETSDLQRKSFNAAFKEADLDWVWSTNLYKDLLKTNGGQNRIKAFAEIQNKNLRDQDIARIHSRKTDIYAEKLKSNDLTLRPGINNLIQDAKSTGIKIGMASTTSPQNINAIFDAAADLNRGDFDFILSGNDVSTVKPHPEIYAMAARHSDCLISDILVIEDTPVSAQSAAAAGLKVVLYTGDMIDDSVRDQGIETVGANDLTLLHLNTLLH